jgi:hypothetical protein
MRIARIATLCALAGLANAAVADDLGSITLFGQAYTVQRFDYSAITWEDPLLPGFDLNLIEVEGAHYLGNDRILLSTDAMDALLSLKNWVIRARIVRDGSGAATGLAYEATVLANDPFVIGYGGFDLSPCGVTINTSGDGLASDGNLLIGDSEENGVDGYSISTGTYLGEWSGGSFNDSFDDLVYVPTDGLVHTINEDGEKIVRFTTSGEYVSDSPTPGMTVLNAGAIAGSPKGMTFLPDSDVVPDAIRDAGGSILVTLDDDNPGLQVYGLDGTVLATEPLTDDPINGGTTLLALESSCGNPLQLEAAAFDAETGTIFLINEGDFFDCNSFFILTPVSSCPSDVNGDTESDIVDFLDFFDSFGVCENQPAPCAGASGVDADFNGDTLVDILDFLDFFDAFGIGC